ncbi:MAG: DUF2127 domain-containing protein [Thermosynechococcaceae cyanobacterium]
MRPRPPALIVIVAYKVFTAILFGVSAISILVAYRHFNALQEWSANFMLAHHHGLIAWVTEHILQLKPRTLAFGALIAGIYSGLSFAEAAGLWLEKAWGRWLVLVLVGLSIPPEIYELHLQFSVLKLLVFLLNLGIFAYVMVRFPKLG